MPYSWHQRGMQGNWIMVSSMYVTFGSLLSLLNLCVHTLFHVSVRSHFDVHTISSHAALLSTTSHTIRCIYNTSEGPSGKRG